MTTRQSIQASVVLLLLVFALVCPSVVTAKDQTPQGISLTPIGSPTWRPVDFHLFAAPVGTAETGYAEYAETVLGLLPPPDHEFNAKLVVGPGVAHPPPYATELAEGVAASGFHEGLRFSGAEFSKGMGVFAAWMNVPDPGVTGSSPDFASGPIIPNSLFPILVNGVALRQGQMFDPYMVSAEVPPLNIEVDEAFDKLDGHSHFPFFVADNADFGKTQQLLPGTYTYQVTMTDAAGNGWQIEANFTVSR
jgi:hypothetical protein